MGPGMMHGQQSMMGFMPPGGPGPMNMGGMPFGGKHGCATLCTVLAVTRCSPTHEWIIAHMQCWEHIACFSCCRKINHDASCFFPMHSLLWCAACFAGMGGPQGPGMGMGMGMGMPTTLSMPGIMAGPGGGGGMMGGPGMQGMGGHQGMGQQLPGPPRMQAPEGMPVMGGGRGRGRGGRGTVMAAAGRGMGMHGGRGGQGMPGFGGGRGGQGQGFSAQGRQGGGGQGEGAVKGAVTAGGSKEVKNDYCQHFVDTGHRPQNFLRDSHLTDR